ncbi:MAG TPA: NADH-quinone oxidoreductase subunit NuoN [Rhizomicrobium sp.]|jgi:NADH-quinone oxidoreductase subunit N|nr:NADH-quinone oxidoreductase subunit NuoN [Rhizomicrobium sp.]
MNLSANLAVLVPELILALGALALLLFGAVRGERGIGLVSALAIILLAASAWFVAMPVTHEARAFGGAFVVDDFARFAKLLILLGSALTLLMAQDFLVSQGLDKFEFPVLILLASTGMMLMVSASSFIALYMGLELQSLALYVLAAFHRDSLRSTEAGLKYFVLGALSSGMMLYGISLIYGFTGTTDFATVGHLVTAGHVGIGVIFGIVFLISGLAFKVSAVPFHMWTPDVYEGAPTPITAFFSMSPKVAAMILFLRAMLGAFPGAIHEWQQIVIFISVLSMALGSFAAIGQTNIKRLMAYSSIGHMGYALLGLAAGTTQGVQGVLIYLLIYVITNAGVFVCILNMRRNGEAVETIADLAGLSRTRPTMAFVFAALMLSLAGIPPLAGFFAKFYVFLAAINAHLYIPAVLGVLASVVGAYYYLRIVKIIYFDDAAPAFDGTMGVKLGTILAGSGLFTVFFVVGAEPLVMAAANAAKALLP